MADEIVIGKIGLTAKGDYVPGELYDILDMVSHEGNSYVSKIQNNNIDITNTEAWLLAAVKGGKGDKGDTFNFDDLTTEQKEELKGDVIAYNSLDEADKDDLANRVPITGVLEDGNTQAVSGGEVYGYVKERYDALGIGFNNNKTLLTDYFQNIDPEDSDMWTDGRFRPSDGELDNIGVMFHSNLIPIEGGIEYITDLYLSTTQSNIQFYDMLGNYISLIGGIKGSPSLEKWEFKAPDNASYYRVNIRYSSAGFVFTGASFGLFYKNTQIIPDNSVFQTKNDVEDVLNEIGLDRRESGVNLLESIILNHDFTDSKKWATGYYYPGGTINNGSPDFIRYIPYIAINPNSVYDVYHTGRASASFIIYDKDLNVTRNLLPNKTNVILETESNEYYCRFSHDLADDINMLKINVIRESVNPIERQQDYNNIKALKSRAKNRVRTPIASFIVDDGRKEDFDWVVSAFKSRKRLCTMAIIGKYAYNGATYHGNLDDIKQVISEGFEICNHTFEHINLPAQTYEEAVKSIVDGDNVIKSIGVDSKIFVPPFGGLTQDVRRFLSSYYEAAFVTGGSIGNMTNTPPLNFRVNRVSFDATTNGVSTLQTCKNAVDEAVLKKSWVVFAIHGGMNEYSPIDNPSGYAQRRQDLLDLIDYCIDSGVNVLPAGKAFDVYKNNVEYKGKLGVDDIYFVRGMDGSVIKSI